MPLHRHHKVIGRRAFEGFDNVVGGAACGDAQAVSDNLGGLMVRRIHGQNDRALRG
jgi:hypothetical protein